MKHYLRYFFSIWKKLAMLLVAQIIVCGSMSALLSFLVSGIPFIAGWDVFFNIIKAAALFLPFLAPMLLGFYWFRQGENFEMPLPGRFFFRYLPFFAPLLLRLVFLFVLKASDTQPFVHDNEGLEILFFLWTCQLLSVLVWGICFAGGAKKAGQPASRKISALALVAMVLLLGFGTAGIEKYHNRFFLQPASAEEAMRNEIDYEQYRPFAANTLTVKADFEPALHIQGEYPRLDGATAFYPVYSALAETVYEGLDESTAGGYISCTTTTRAFSLLAEGKSDLIFCLEPSRQQLEEANGAGVEFILTPIMQEAFVFFVNEQNPVQGLTHAQIQDIYQRRITNWRDVGGENRSILAFQRPANSGSQTIMLSEVMLGKEMAQPLVEEQQMEMGDILVYTAEYRNSAAALGYSFRYYATVMNPQAGLRLLAIDGIEPTVESVRAGAYPFTVPVYAVTTRAGLENPNTQRLIDWLRTEQGRHLIELCGYVPYQGTL